MSWGKGTAIEFRQLQKLEDKKKKEESLRKEKRGRNKFRKKTPYGLKNWKLQSNEHERKRFLYLQALKKEQAQQNEEKMLSEKTQGQGKAYTVSSREEIVKDKEDYSKTEATRNKKLELELEREKRAEKEELKEFQRKELWSRKL